MGCCVASCGALHFRCRQTLAARQRYPTVAIIDSQSVKTGKMGGERGYDGGKRVKGRKRHLVVDTLGLPMGLAVTAANVHDTKGAQRALQRAREFLRGRPLKKVYADGGYRGEPFKNYVRAQFKARVITSRNPATRSKVFKTSLSALGCRTQLRLALRLPPLDHRLRASASQQPRHDLSGRDQVDAESTGRYVVSCGNEVRLCCYSEQPFYSRFGFSRLAGV